MKTMFFVMMMLTSVSVVWAQDGSVAFLTEQSAEATTDSTVTDYVIEEHIMRLAFDNGYDGGTLEQVAECYLDDWGQWEDWEEYYFERESYRLKLENFLQKHWSIGPWWWQTQIKVEVLDELDRGGPIHFKVDYPLVDFRDDLVFEVSKDLSGETIIVFQGNFNSQRLSYLLATLIMVSILIIFGLTLFFMGKWLWMIFDGLVTILANQFSEGHGHNKWHWRFAACIIGAFICAILMIMWTFL